MGSYAHEFRWVVGGMVHPLGRAPLPHSELDRGERRPGRTTLGPHGARAHGTRAARRLPRVAQRQVAAETRRAPC
jgi:hypothetical protein